MGKWQTKDAGYIEDIDKEKRIVKSVVAVFNNEDLDGDIIIPEAVTKTINERGPNGKKLIINLIDHVAGLRTTLGKPNSLYVESNKLFAVTPIVETELGEDYIKLCEAGVVNQYSIGFSTIKSKMQGEVRVIQELMLYEYSAVVWGANPETSFVGIKSEFKPEQDLSKRLDRLYHTYKHGTYTDETFSLIEIEIKQIQQAILELSTPPAVKAVEPPPNEALLKALTQFNNTLKNF